MAALNKELQEKYGRLLQEMRSLQKVVVAFSGGLDSGFLLHAAIKALGVENVLAVTADSESLPRGELSYACRFAQQIGVADYHIVIQTKELDNACYSANPVERCFYCKQELYGKLITIAQRKGIEHIIDGCNASDVGDHRPGRRAALQLGIESPLLKADLGKEDIRQLARQEKLDVWDKPQAACLASRIPYGETVTAEKLKMIEQAEDFLRKEGFRQLRVRHHGRTARIELEEKDFHRVLKSSLRQNILNKFRSLGFSWVTVDLQGFKSGSLNAVLEDVETIPVSKA
jgi:uncharacterized protein